MPATSARLASSYWPADRSQPLLDTTVGDLLRAAAAQVPGRLALVEGSADPAARRTWTYAELLMVAERAARALLTRFAPGERVAVWAPNCPEWMLLQHGVSLAGMVLVTVNPALRRRELRYVLAQSQAAGIFFADEYRGFDLADAVASLRDGLPGLREAIPLSEWDTFVASADSHASPRGRHPAAGAAGGPRADPVHLRDDRVPQGRDPAPSRGRERVAFRRPRVRGRRRRCLGQRDAHVPCRRRDTHRAGHDRPARHVRAVPPGFDPGLVLELVEAYRGTIMLAVPTMLLALLDEPGLAARDLSSLQTVMSGAAVVPAALVRRATETFGCQFTIVFGQTELHGVISQTQLDDSAEDQSETIGRPLPQVEVKIADPVTGDVMPVGQVGEICARGYQTMLGYFGMPRETAAVLDGSGWLRTGDLAAMDGRGYLTITGREDMIIRGGENIYRREVEDVLFAHPAVSQVAVVGLADEKWENAWPR